MKPLALGKTVNSNSRLFHISCNLVDLRSCFRYRLSLYNDDFALDEFYYIKDYKVALACFYFLCQR